MEKPQSQLPQGTYLQNGTYRIVSVLGRGGFGITYLAMHEGLGKRMAIKEFFPKGLFNRDTFSTSLLVSSLENIEMTSRLKTKFVKEAQRLAKLHHDSIVAVSNAFEENGTAYYVMDYIDGQNLQQIVKSNGPLSIERALRYIKQVGMALEYLHSLRINHLDVKPANILIDPSNDRAILIDFGLSKHYDENDGQTSTSPVGVSHGYAPGEQYVPGGVKKFSAPTDVYSLAATLFFLLVGERPPSANELMEQPLVFPAGIPYYIQAAISKAMRNARSDRYPTVAAFLAALKSGGNDSKPVEFAVKSGRSKRNNRFSLLIWLLIAIAVVATGIYLTFMSRQGRSDEHLTGTTPVEQHLNPPTLIDSDTIKYTIPKNTIPPVNVDTTKNSDKDNDGTKPIPEEKPKTVFKTEPTPADYPKPDPKAKIQSELKQATHSSPKNLDLQVVWNGHGTVYVSESAWRRLSTVARKELTPRGLNVVDARGSFILNLRDKSTGVTWNEASRSGFSKDQAQAIANNASAINAALKAFGGTPMDGIYWTNEQEGETTAWALKMPAGKISYDIKSNKRKVR